jgi:hypothetical protein
MSCRFGMAKQGRMTFSIQAQGVSGLVERDDLCRLALGALLNSEYRCRIVLKHRWLLLVFGS